MPFVAFISDIADVSLLWYNDFDKKAEVISMSLISCPECGKEVSDRSDLCIHCGYPLVDFVNAGKLYSVTITDIVGNSGGEKRNHRATISSILEHFYNVPDKITFSGSIIMEDLEHLPKMVLTGIPHKYINLVKEDFESIWCIVKIDEFNGDEAAGIDYDAIRNRLERIKAKTRCPRCSSDKITTSSRGYSLLWGFLGSGSTVNRCGNCGHTWKP